MGIIIGSIFIGVMLGLALEFAVAINDILNEIEID